MNLLCQCDDNAIAKRCGRDGNESGRIDWTGFDVI